MSWLKKCPSCGNAFALWHKHTESYALGYDQCKFCGYIPLVAEGDKCPSCEKINSYVVQERIVQGRKQDRILHIWVCKNCGASSTRGSPNSPNAGWKNRDGGDVCHHCWSGWITEDEWKHSIAERKGNTVLYETGRVTTGTIIRARSGICPSCNTEVIQYQIETEEDRAGSDNVNRYTGPWGLHYLEEYLHEEENKRLFASEKYLHEKNMENQHTYFARKNRY
jgi:rubrerythrin